MRRIVIIGGGIMGSAIAYNLARAGAAADVTVVEPDPTYEFAATPRAVGGIRLQHAIPENGQMSLHGDEVYSAFDRHVTGGKVTFDPNFQRLGYLYLVRGAAAPVVEMQKEALRARVNAVYGYNAIARILLTQTAATGFAEGQAQFTPAPKVPPPPDPALEAEARAKAEGVADEGLRAALERLGQNILTRRKAAEDKR